MFKMQSVHCTMLTLNSSV